MPPDLRSPMAAAEAGAHAPGDRRVGASNEIAEIPQPDAEAVARVALIRR